MIRAPRRGGRASLVGSVVALGGTIGPIALTFAPVQTDQMLVAIGSAATIVGLALSVYALPTLGRCFGLFPEARGLITHGPYSLVRHSLYVAEFVTVGGVVIGSLSLMSVAVYVGLTGLQVWRAVNEEQALAAVFPEYRSYRERTARFIPSVG